MGFRYVSLNRQSVVAHDGTCSVAREFGLSYANGDYFALSAALMGSDLRSVESRVSFSRAEAEMLRDALTAALCAPAESAANGAA